MKHAILAISFFLVTVIGKVFVESPTPDLLQVRRKGINHWLIVQVQTGSYLKFRNSAFTMPPTRYHPNDNVELRYYQQSELHEEGHYETEESQAGACWMMAILPSMGAIISGVSVNSWLEQTGFSDDTTQELQSWLDYRSLDDDYTVVLLSDDFKSPTLKQFKTWEGTFKILPKPVGISRIKRN